MAMAAVGSVVAGTHRYRLVIAVLLQVFNLFAGLNFGAVPPILPLIMDDYGLNRSVASLLVALIIVVQAALAIPGGMLVARSPLKALTVVGWVAAGAMVLVPLAGSFWVLL